MSPETASQPLAQKAYCSAPAASAATGASRRSAAMKTRYRPTSRSGGRLSTTPRGASQSVSLMYGSRYLESALTDSPPRTMPENAESSAAESASHDQSIRDASRAAAASASPSCGESSHPLGRMAAFFLQTATRKSRRPGRPGTSPTGGALGSGVSSDPNAGMCFSWSPRTTPACAAFARICSWSTRSSARLRCERGNWRA